LTCRLSKQKQERSLPSGDSYGALSVNDIVWVDLSNTEHDSLGKYPIAPWPGTLLEVLRDPFEVIFSKVRVEFFEETGSHVVLIAR
jgi:hypothetical protein